MKKVFYFTLLAFYLYSLSGSSQEIADFTSKKGRSRFFMIGVSFHNLNNLNLTLRENSFEEISQAHFQGIVGNNIRFKRFWIGINAFLGNHLKSLKNVKAWSIGGDINIGFNVIQKKIITIGGGIGLNYSSMYVSSESINQNTSTLFPSGNAINLNNQSFLPDVFIVSNFIPDMKYPNRILRAQIGYRTSTSGQSNWEVKGNTKVDLKDDFSHFYIQLGIGLSKN